ncbi:MAG: CopD family protein [Candidatus Saccharibacteria bacterium]|nr:CopD family protein [Pseudorhodobacter sp.]
MNWVDGLIPHMKALHLGFLAVWVAGLIALPQMLARHDRAIVQGEFAQIRRATHYGYVWLITPAAILAIGSGGALIFMRDVFTVWIMAKLVLVAGLVAVHAWVGHTIVAVAETEGQHEPPEPLFSTIIIAGLVIGILSLVLAKPDLEGLPMPSWLLAPLGRQLPFDIPSR